MPTIYGDTTDGGTLSRGNASFIAGRTSGGSNSYSGSTTGSPTVTTDGSYKVIKFTSTGTYVA